MYNVCFGISVGCSVLSGTAAKRSIAFGAEDGRAARRQYRRAKTECRRNQGCLYALVNGVHTGFTQSAILANYRLGTAANITRLKKALIEKDLVMITAPKYLEMSDPILAQP